MKMVKNYGQHRPHLLLMILSSEEILRKAFPDRRHINANLHHTFIPRMYVDPRTETAEAY